MPGIKYESEPQLNWIVGFTREGKIFALSPCLSSSQGARISIRRVPQNPRVAV